MARLNFRQASVQMRSRLMGEERRKELVALARETINQATALNRAAIGHDVGRTIIVDGRAGASVDSVKIGGTVVAIFAAHEAVVDFVWQTIVGLSPVDRRPNADDIVFKDRHRMLVNGVEAGEPPVTIGPDDVVVFVNLLPYARRIEKGWSRRQAPDGVFEAAAAIARARFGRVASIKFGYGSFFGAEAGASSRYPFIEIAPRGARR